MCSPEEEKSSKGNPNLLAWITLGFTFLFILFMALMVFLKVGIGENQQSDNSESRADFSPTISLPGGHIGVPYKLFNERKSRICTNDTCGIDAICSKGNCACPEKHVGDPTIKCEKPECIEINDCHGNQTCYEEKCVDPCGNDCAYQNARCVVLTHIPFCVCPMEYYENPAFGDCEVFTLKAAAKDNQTAEEPGTTEASANTEEPSEGGELQDLCNPSPCAPETTCYISQGLAFCEGFYIPPNEFLTSTSKPQHECESDDECDPDFACRDYECVDPCLDCDKNAMCAMSNHSAFCKCPRGIPGDPYDKCITECEEDDDCPDTKATCVYYSCVNPCDGACGINAHCDYRGNETFCYCPRNTTGNPHVFCRPTGISVDDFCDPNPCGVKASCIVISESVNKTEEYPLCYCPEGYLGFPRISCEQTAECHEHSDCEDSWECTYNVCLDPCIDDYGNSVCGVGAVCESRGHLAICSCRKGTHGDPFVSCYGGGDGGGGGHQQGGLSPQMIASLLG